MILLWLAACAFSPGQGWSTLDAVQLSAALEPGPARDLGDHTLLTDQGHEARLDILTAGLGQVRVETLSGGSVDFDPANPPEGYSLCHGGHCHAEDGSLVDYATIEAELAGEDAVFIPVAAVEVGRTVDLLEGVDLVLPSAQLLDRERLVRVALDVDGLWLEGEADGEHPLEASLELDEPLSATLGVEVDRDLPTVVDLVVHWTVDGTLLDGQDLAEPLDSELLEAALFSNTPSVSLEEP